MANHELGRYDEQLLRALYLLTRDFESRPLEKRDCEVPEQDEEAASGDAVDATKSGVLARGRVPRL